MISAYLSRSTAPNGRSTGSPEEDGLYLDGHAAMDFLEARGVKSDGVFLLGRSLGGAVAVKIALERPVAGVAAPDEY